MALTNTALSVAVWRAWRAGRLAPREPVAALRPAANSPFSTVKASTLQ
jgi:hypothetical protein